MSGNSTETFGETSYLGLISMGWSLTRDHDTIAARKGVSAGRKSTLRYGLGLKSGPPRVSLCRPMPAESSSLPSAHSQGRCQSFWNLDALDVGDHLAHLAGVHLEPAESGHRVGAEVDEGAEVELRVPRLVLQSLRAGEAMGRGWRE